MPAKNRRGQRYTKNRNTIPTIMLMALLGTMVVLMVVILVQTNSSSQPTTQTITYATPTEYAAAATEVATVIDPALNTENITTEQPVIETTEVPVIATNPPVDSNIKTIHIRAAGDIIVHDDQLKTALQSDGTYDFDPSFTYVSDSLADADFTTVNFETTTGGPGKKGYGGWPYFHTPPSIITTLRNCGIDLLTNANNHIYDRYFDGLVETLNTFDEMGMAHYGTFRNETEYKTPYIMEINGVKFGFACYTINTNRRERYCDPLGVKWAVTYLIQSPYVEDVQVANFTADAEKLKNAGAEVLVCIPHWGDEYARQPNDEQKQWAQQMANAGFDIILGSHTHTVQDIVWVNGTRSDGTTHRTLCVYSMGNFISAQRDQYCDTGIIVDFTVTYNTQTQSVEIDNVGYVPCWVWQYPLGVDDKNNYVVLPIGETLNNIPSNMSSDSQTRMRAAWNETNEIITTEGITALAK